MMLTTFLTVLAVAAEAVQEEHTILSMSLISVFIIGFVAAAGFGSVAWYNSKRPLGWEEKERPPVVPEIEQEETPGIGNPLTE